MNVNWTRLVSDLDKLEKVLGTNKSENDFMIKRESSSDSDCIRSPFLRQICGEYEP